MKQLLQVLCLVLVLTTLASRAWHSNEMEAARLAVLYVVCIGFGLTMRGLVELRGRK